MQVSGTGITTIDIKIKPDFRPITKLALKWYPLSDGNWTATDRGADSDVYQSKFRLYRWETDINNFLDEIEANRVAENNVVRLSNFTSTEYIFGADVDHSTYIDVNVINISERFQRSWKGWGVDVTVQALSPTFTGSSSLPVLKWLGRGYKADATRTINKFDSYDGTFDNQEHFSDAGFFEGVFRFATDDMISLRRYIATERSDTIVISDIYGVDYPFGARRGGFPISVKIVDWDDLGMVNPREWDIRLKFAEVI